MRPPSEAAGMGRRCGYDDLTGGPSAGVRPPPSASGLTVVGHDG